MSDRSRLPTRAEAADLPRRVLVAYSARCARRVLPLYPFDGEWRRHRVAVERAIEAAERWAAHGGTVDRRVLSDAGAASCAEVHDEDEFVPDHIAESAPYHVALAAYRAAWLAENPGGPGVQDTSWTHAARASRRAVVWHDSHVFSRDWSAEVIQAMTTDWELIRKHLRAGPDGLIHLTTGFFGPMWPCGAPDGWPVGDPARPPRLFVSYRRADSEQTVSRLVDRLELALAPGQVFLDERAIDAGESWPDRLRRELVACTVFLCVIGRQWLGKDQHGLRIDDPDDVLRREVEMALERAESEDLVFLPVVVDGASLPARASLPRSIASLADRQCLRLRDAEWDAGFDQILRILRRLRFQFTAAL